VGAAIKLLLYTTDSVFGTPWQFFEEFHVRWEYLRRLLDPSESKLTNLYRFALHNSLFHPDMVVGGSLVPLQQLEQWPGNSNQKEKPTRAVSRQEGTVKDLKRIKKNSLLHPAPGNRGFDIGVVMEDSTKQSIFVGIEVKWSLHTNGKPSAKTNVKAISRKFNDVIKDFEPHLIKMIPIVLSIDSDWTGIACSWFMLHTEILLDLFARFCQTVIGCRKAILVIPFQWGSLRLTESD